MRLLFEVQFALESLELPCPITVCLVILSILHLEWKLMACVSFISLLSEGVTLITKFAAGKIHVTESTHVSLEKLGYKTEMRGEIAIKVCKKDTNV